MSNTRILRYFANVVSLLMKRHLSLITTQMQKNFVITSWLSIIDFFTSHFMIINHELWKTEQYFDFTIFFETQKVLYSSHDYQPRDFYNWAILWFNFNIHTRSFLWLLIYLRYSKKWMIICFIIIISNVQFQICVSHEYLFFFVSHIS